MSQQRKIEIFSAGCNVCGSIIEEIRGIACDSCEVIVLDMQDPLVSARARDMGIQSVPAVAIDGQLAECCAGRSVNTDALRAAGLGQAI